MISSAKKKYIVLCLVCLCSSLFFWGLYQFNNKYTQNTIQAANGVLSLSEKDLTEAPLRFLISGWEFYPDVLLRPDEIRYSDHYMKYLSIGEQTGFSSFANSSPYGCGTYRITFFLPENTEGYALELPEIFSAYTLYRNDERILQMGEPSSAISQIQNRTINFYGGEPVTFTIAVSNYTHFYGGMIYPPALGTKQTIDTFRGIRFAVCLAGCTVTLICTFLSFYLSLRLKKKNTLLFGLICLAMCGFSSYPVLHMLFPLPVFPCYALELFSFYLATALIVVLQNRICKARYLPAVISNTSCAFFSLFALGYGLLSSQLSLSAIHLFSSLVFCYKAALSLYLLISSLAAIHRGEKHIKILFYASITAACALVWDRLLPVYEPIVGGWYMEWGCFFVVFAIGCFLWHDITEGYGTGLILQEERKQIIRQLSMQTEYNRKIQESVSENRRLIHDIKHHLRTIERMAEEHGQTDICTFLSQVEGQIMPSGSHSHTAFCNNPVLNALIEYYAGIARTQNTEFQVQLNFPDSIPLSDVELCTVFGNLLDNAVEACERQKQGVRHILIAGELRGNMYFLKIENTYDGQITIKNNTISSHKEASPYHGIGLSSVRKIIETHGGSLDIVPEKKKFLVGISLYS